MTTGTYLERLLMFHADTQRVLITYCVMYQGITSRFIERAINSISVDHAKQICFVALFCSHVKQKAIQCLMNTEFHATLRAGIIIDMSNTQSMDQTRC